MNSPRRVISDNISLRQHYQELSAGDVCVGRIRLRPSEEHLLLDLVERGVQFIPSALSQLASRSKAMQALMFSEYMLPHTKAIHDLYGLLDAMTQYRKLGIASVVTKQDRSNAGRGVHYWSALEEVYNHASLGLLAMPFVLQPFYEACRDIRVVVLGDYQEAYWRHNPHNFRNNLSLGGESKPAKLTVEQQNICRRVMKRGKYLYAHIDLMVTPTGESYLAEINLRGGIKGAQIHPDEYRSRVEAVHQQELEALIGG